MVPFLTKGPFRCSFIAWMEEWFYTGFGYGFEQVLENPREPWSCQFDGWFGIHFEELNLEFLSARSLVMCDEKVNAKQLESIGQWLVEQTS